MPKRNSLQSTKNNKKKSIKPYSKAQGYYQVFMRCKAVRRCNNVQFIANSIF